MQRELEVQRRESEEMQKELLDLKKENSKLVAAASKFDCRVALLFALLLPLSIDLNLC